MRGSSLAVHVTSPSPSAIYSGPTAPPFIHNITQHTPDSAKLTKFVDVSAVLAAREIGLEIRVAIVNRSDKDEFDVPILFGPDVQGVGETINIYEIWSPDLKDANGFNEEKVKTVHRKEKFGGIYKLKKHSFQGILLPCCVSKN